MIIQHIQKPANGCVPDHYLQADEGSDSDSSDSDVMFKPAKFSMEKILKDKAFRRRQHQSNIPSGATLSPSDEERLARWVFNHLWFVFSLAKKVFVCRK